MNKKDELGLLELFAGVQIVKFVVPLLLGALVIILLVFLAISVIWAAFAFFVDWWFAWCGIPIVVAAIAYYKTTSVRQVVESIADFINGKKLTEEIRKNAYDSESSSTVFEATPTKRWKLITAMVIPGIIAVVMIGFGISGKSAVWTGTGFTRGPDAWVSPWNDDCGRPIWDDNYEKYSCTG